MLDTETLSSFNNGAYLQWSVTGHVQVVVTCLAGPNAVVNGIFLDAPSSTPTPTPTATAAFVKTDAVTSGNWVGAYGGQGYDIDGTAPSLPSYAGVTVGGGATSYTSATGTTDARRLSRPAAARRGARWSGTGRASRLTSTRPTASRTCCRSTRWTGPAPAGPSGSRWSTRSTGKVLDTETLSSFGNGAYLQWSVTGHVQVVVTSLAGPNAVVNGIFLDAPSSSSSKASVASTSVSTGQQPAATTAGTAVGTLAVTSSTSNPVASHTTNRPNYTVVPTAGRLTWSRALVAASNAGLPAQGRFARLIGG